MARGRTSRTGDVRDEEMTGLFERDALVYAAARRRAMIDKQYEGLVFGRLDRSADLSEAERHLYIGRIAVNDEEQEPLVVDWRAPAEPFYRATPVGPMGVVRRRHFLTGHGQGRVGLDDDDEVSTKAPDRGRGVGEAALLAALDRARWRRMGDIVATIQARAGRGDPGRPRRRPRSSAAAPAPARPRWRCTAPRTSSTPTARSSAARACCSSVPARSSCATSTRCCRRSGRTRSISRRRGRPQAPVPGAGRRPRRRRGRSRVTPGWPASWSVRCATVSTSCPATSSSGRRRDPAPHPPRLPEGHRAGPARADPQREAAPGGPPGRRPAHRPVPAGLRRRGARRPRLGPGGRGSDPPDAGGEGRARADVAGAQRGRAHPRPVQLRGIGALGGTTIRGAGAARCLVARRGTAELFDTTLRAHRQAEARPGPARSRPSTPTTACPDTEALRAVAWAGSRRCEVGVERDAGRCRRTGGGTPYERGVGEPRRRAGSATCSSTRPRTSPRCSGACSPAAARRVR